MNLKLNLKKFSLFISILVIVIAISGCTNSSEQADSNNKLDDLIKQGEQKANKQVPDDLIQCPEDIFSTMDSCFDLEENWVCGYDHTIYENGTEKDNGLDYKTPCHYCNFFGPDLKKDMMGTQVKALGYTMGKCN